MTLHHGNRLRCKNGPWTGDAVLSESVAAGLRAWFARQGYDNFERWETLINDSQRVYGVDKERVLSHFAPEVRRLFPNQSEDSWMVNKRKAPDLAASFRNPQAMIMTCWRALGESQRPKGHGSPYNALLIATLETASEQDLKESLLALSLEPPSTLIGAYNHASSPAWREPLKITKILDDTWFVRLAEKQFEHGDLHVARGVVSKLAARPSKESVELLVRIAQGDIPTNYGDEAAGEGLYRVNPSTLALFELAAMGEYRAKELIRHRLTQDICDEERTILEVGLAHYGDFNRLSKRHLNCPVGKVADHTWKLISSDPAFDPSLELLVVASRSRSYKMQKEAREILKKRGVRVLEAREEAELIFSKEPFRSAKLLPDLDQLIAKCLDAATPYRPASLNTALLTQLYFRRPSVHLANGYYEKARKNLKYHATNSLKAQLDPSFIFQTLGRFDEARSTLFFASRESRVVPAAEYLKREGFLLFSEGKFAAAAERFNASLLLDAESIDQVNLYRQLSLQLAGKIDEKSIEDTYSLSFYIVVEDRTLWPQAGLGLLRGDLREEDVLKSIKTTSSHNQLNDLCEAHYVMSMLRRLKNDQAGEKKHLAASIETRCYTLHAYSMAMVRLREIDLLHQAVIQ